MKALSGDHMTIAPSKLVVHNKSHTIAKQKPKIRIIHIVAPEIIKTDAQNFRELVQKLTGKQGSKKKGENVSSSVPRPKAFRSTPFKHLQSTSMPMLPRTITKQETEGIHGGGISNPFLSILGDTSMDSYMISMNSHYFH